MQCVTALPGAETPADEALATQATIRYERVHQSAEEREAQAPFSRGGGPRALPEGTEIEGFRILRQIGEGGFGIVYLAWDPALERQVAIKEYMPASLAVRGSVSLDVSMLSDEHRETFAAGLKSFVNEARLLARFDHPALVKVLRYWTANGTAYMAMPYYEGPTLKTALAHLGSPPPEALLLEWLHPLLDALDVMHGENCYHRDISPDNILLTAGGPLLLDFGAARHVINDRTQVLTTMLKPGFAPIEQYGGTMLQGPWTDLYALASVLYFAIAGRPPIASVVRIVKDSVQPLSQTHAAQYSGAFLHAIDSALAVRPESRPQDVSAFRAMLSPIAQATPRASAVHVTAPHGGRKARRSAVAAIGLLAALALAAWMNGREQDVPQNPAAAMQTAPALPPATPASTAVETPARVEVVAPPPVVASTPPAAPATAYSAKVAPRKPPPSPRPVAAATEQSAELVSEKNRTLSEGGAATPSYIASSRPPRCSDLVLKSSLEALNPEEAEFQKTRCK
ncbi:serine/threonine-protein kinase [Variovorax sp. J22P168]|uniref:serine/threonine protein kinase n=1 Tax=Variovorax jilinensis TaxID=3053513 RepID=UPI002578F664|nr:serine/threonine-protein kinase [Variovorax sp. J22P168]MDM0014953.1 serine/threonine-protein kinase [Variovorax sp. J22P168]